MGATPLNFSTKLLALVWMSVESFRMMQELQSTGFMSFT